MPLEGLQVGHYRLLRFIGSGAMGEVYLAEDTRIARQVAVKVVKNEVDPYPDAQATDTALRLFQREMKAIAALDHPNILSLFDFGEQTIEKTTYTYMVMPFRSEGSLIDWLRQRTSTARLVPQEVIELVHQAADALQHAHNRHLLHLDVKPSNFLIRHHEDSSRRPEVLLADFGISKFNTTTSTASQTIRGTPAYMAPEQWTGTPSEATDQYALAIMTYQLLTGRFPFEGNMQQVMYKHLQEDPQPPSAFNPQIPPRVDRVILKALEKKPEGRFPSVQAFATAFEQAWRSEESNAEPSPSQKWYITPTPLRSSINTSELPPTQYAPPVPASFPTKPRISRQTAIIGLIIVIIGSGLAFALIQHSSVSNSKKSSANNSSTSSPTSNNNPSYPQLNPSYSGYQTDRDGTYHFPIELASIVENANGHFTGRQVDDNGILWSIDGTVSSDGKLTFVEAGLNYGAVGQKKDCTGFIYPDGHLQGNWQGEGGDDYGTWYVT